jgi:hypothetical protein
LVETSERQAPMTAEIFAQYGLLPKLTRSEEQDATVVIGTKTAHNKLVGIDITPIFPDGTIEWE